MFVLVSFFPHRTPDLLLYNLLILRTAAQFGGGAWRNYDEAFRREAAARGLTDWSHMNVELYNVHTTYNRFPRSSVRPSTGSSSTSSSFFCRSRNSERCTAFGRHCRYRHTCDRLGCGGFHRRVECPLYSASVSSTPRAVAHLETVDGR